MSALRQESRHCCLTLKDDVEVALGWRWRGSFARPLDTDGSKRFEGIQETFLGDVPWNSAQEHLGAVQGILVLSGRKLSRPGASGIIEAGSTAIQLGGTVEGGWICRVSGEHVLDMLSVRQQRSCSNLTQRHLTWQLALGNTEQRIENVRRMVLVGMVSIHIWSCGVALDGVAHSRV